MAHGDAREWESEGESWRMQWVASTLHTTSEHGVSSITTADAHTSAGQQSTELTPHPPADLNGLVRFARKTKSGFCACDVTFQLACTALHSVTLWVISIILHPSRPPLGPTKPPVQWVLSHSRGVKRTVVKVNNPPPYFAPRLTLNLLTWKIW